MDDWSEEPRLTLKDFGYGLVPAHRHPYGGGWVADTATVHDTAYVGRKALVSGDARVLAYARICERARIRDDAVVSDYAKVCGNARVEDDAFVGGTAHLSGNAKLSGRDSVTEGYVR